MIKKIIGEINNPIVRIKFDVRAFDIIVLNKIIITIIPLPYLLEKVVKFSKKVISLFSVVLLQYNFPNVSFFIVKYLSKNTNKHTKPYKTADHIFPSTIAVPEIVKIRPWKQNSTASKEKLRI